MHDRCSRTATVHHLGWSMPQRKAAFTGKPGPDMLYLQVMASLDVTLLTSAKRNARDHTLVYCRSHSPVPVPWEHYIVSLICMLSFYLMLRLHLSLVSPVHPRALNHASSSHPLRRDLDRLPPYRLRGKKGSAAFFFLRTGAGCGTTAGASAVVAAAATGIGRSPVGSKTGIRSAPRQSRLRPYPAT